MSFARTFDRFRRHDVQVAGISIDSIPNNAAMVEKLLLPFPLLSDARGELIHLYGLWDEAEHVSRPAIFVVDRAGIARFTYTGRDFADRPSDDELMQAIDRCGGSSQGVDIGAPRVVVAADEARMSIASERKPITLEFLLPYYRGAFYATVAMKSRLSTLGGARDAVPEVGRYQRLLQEYEPHIRETMRMKQALSE